MTWAGPGLSRLFFPEGTVWKTDLSQDAWQLFVDYQEEMPARWPNANFSDGTALNDDEYWAHGSVDVDDYETDATTPCNDGMVKYQAVASTTA